MQLRKIEPFLVLCLNAQMTNELNWCYAQSIESIHKHLMLFKRSTKVTTKPNNNTFRKQWRKWSNYIKQAQMLWKFSYLINRFEFLCFSATYSNSLFHSSVNNIEIYWLPKTFFIREKTVLQKIKMEFSKYDITNENFVSFRLIKHMTCEKLFWFTKKCTSGVNIDLGITV